jgi:hypothetical protein
LEQSYFGETVVEHPIDDSQDPDCQLSSERGSSASEGRAATVAQADLEVFRLACEHFRQDISSHWTQASFFSLIQAAFISVFAAAVGPRDEDWASLLDVKVFLTGFGVVAVAFALLWFVTAWGREKYIRMWRNAVVHMDGVVDRHNVYTIIEAEAGPDRWNPTRITTAVPAVIGVGWIVAIGWIQFALP